MSDTVNDTILRLCERREFYKHSARLCLPLWLTLEGPIRDEIGKDIVYASTLAEAFAIVLDPPPRRAAT